MLAEKLTHEEDQVQVLRLFLWGVRIVLCVSICESFRHDIEEKLEAVSRDHYFGSVKRINKLKQVYIAVSAFIGCSQGLLKHNTLVRESESSDLLENLLGPVEIDLLMELNFLSILTLD